jgi:signal peptide peptidase SppA
MKSNLLKDSVLLIDPKRFSDRCEMVCDSTIEAEAAGQNKFWDGKHDAWGDPIPEMVMEDGIATIPVKGVLVSGMPTIYERYGFLNTEKVISNILAAKEAGARGILLDVNSPGGMVSGTIELGEVVADLQKEGFPIKAVTFGEMCSAAYWLSAGARGIFASKSADVGSIGVYVAHVDVSMAFEKFGYRVQVFKAGKLKGMGYPGTSLTEEQKDHIQARVDRIYSLFTNHVTTYRGKIPESAMQGQSMMAPEALENGLIDGIVKSIDEVKAMIS